MKLCFSRQKLEDLRRSGNRAGVDAYAKRWQYQRALDAARTAFRESIENKADPTAGRFYFNNRYNDWKGQRRIGVDKYGRGGEPVNLNWRSPRFQWGNTPVYSLVYENPKKMPHTPEEQEKIRAQQAAQHKAQAIRHGNK